jgi:hypothetical protein
MSRRVQLHLQRKAVKGRWLWFAGFPNPLAGDHPNQNSLMVASKTARISKGSIVIGVYLCLVSSHLSQQDGMEF